MIFKKIHLTHDEVKYVGSSLLNSQDITKARNQGLLFFSLFNKGLSLKGCLAGGEIETLLGQ